jgi:hypothetical protein
MVDSRDKGARAEAAVRKFLKDKTGLKWERTPGSGALNEKHKLKGDIYVPDEKNNFCVEVKHYKDDHFNSSLFTGKTPQIITWWSQAVRQGIQVNRKPLLIFKFDRSKLFVAFEEMPTATYRYAFLNIDEYEFYVALLEDYINFENPKFIS